jgi:hypothetical protein
MVMMFMRFRCGEGLPWSQQKKTRVSIASRQPSVKTRCCGAASVFRLCTGQSGRRTGAARQATCGGVWSENYPGLSPRPECAWSIPLYLVHAPVRTGEDQVRAFVARPRVVGDETPRGRCRTCSRACNEARTIGTCSIRAPRVPKNTEEGLLESI